MSAVVPIYHVITPGDHFSPRTGSAIPTVVNGLARGAAVAGDAARLPQHVVVQADTFEPRYDSAEAITYRSGTVPGSRGRIVDAARARVGLRRTAVADWFRPAVTSLASRPPGIVLAHNAPIVSELLADGPHTPILYAHNHVLRSYTRAEASRVIGDATTIISVSEALAAQLRENLPRSLHNRIRTVVNGVDADLFAPANARGAGPLRAMFLGRAIPDKGADLLLEAAERMTAGGVELHIVGSSNFDAAAELSLFERRLRELADRIPERVVFHPFVDRDRVPELLRTADILVIPSRWPDPCPLAVAEGMATGLPIVASRVGGIPELLGDSGILFDPDRPAELAEALDSLAADSELRRHYAGAARSRAVARDWTWTWRVLAAVLDGIR